MLALVTENTKPFLIRIFGFVSINRILSQVPGNTEDTFSSYEPDIKKQKTEGSLSENSDHERSSAAPSVATHATRGVHSTVTASGAQWCQALHVGGRRATSVRTGGLVESESCPFNRLLGGRAAADGGTARSAMQAARVPARVFI